jgi:hypothetical protein
MSRLVEIALIGAFVASLLFVSGAWACDEPDTDEVCAPLHTGGMDAAGLDAADRAYLDRLGIVPRAYDEGVEFATRSRHLRPRARTPCRGTRIRSTGDAKTAFPTMN